MWETEYFGRMLTTFKAEILEKEYFGQFLRKSGREAE